MIQLSMDSFRDLCVVKNLTDQGIDEAFVSCFREGPPQHDAASEVWVQATSSAGRKQRLQGRQLDRHVLSCR